MKTIESLGDLKGKRVLVRSDFNVPLDADKNITDDGRIQAALPTLRTLLDAGAKVIITAHLGRPKGQVNPDYSLAPVAKRLAEVTGAKVTLAEDTVGESAKAAVAAVEDVRAGRPSDPAQITAGEQQDPPVGAPRESVRIERVDADGAGSVVDAEIIDETGERS